MLLGIVRKSLVTFIVAIIALILIGVGYGSVASAWSWPYLDVDIDSPSDSSIVSGSVDVYVSTDSNRSVLRVGSFIAQPSFPDVEFQRCGEVWSADSLVCTIDTSTLSDGEYLLVAGAIGRSLIPLIDVTHIHLVVDNTKPVVDVDPPLNNQAIRDDYTAHVTASDQNGISVVAGHMYDETGATLLVPCSNSAVAGASLFTLECLLETKDYPDGSYLLKGAAFDQAGNFGKDFVPFVIDNTAPSMSNINMLVSTDGGTTYVDNDYVKPGDKVRIEVEAEDLSSGIRDVEFRVKRSGAGGYIAPRTYITTPAYANVYQFDFQVPPDGKYIDLHTPISEVFEDNVYWARATDMAGNYNHGVSDLFTFDDTAPTIPVHLSPADGSFGTTATQLKVDWDDVTDPSSPVTYKYQSSYSPDTNPVDNSFVSPVYNSGVLASSDIPTPGTPEGVYYWHVKAIDAAGNQSNWSDAWKITVDNTAPTTPTVLGFLSPTLPCGVITNIHSTTVDWTDSTDATSGIKGYQYAIDYPLVGGGTGHWETFLSPSQRSGALNEGLHTIMVRAQDNSGNYSNWSNACTITADWTAPDVDAGADRGNQSAQFAQVGTATDANFIVSTTWSQTSGPGNVLATGGTTLNPTLNADTDGTYVVRLTATDNAGNSNFDEFEFTWVTPAVLGVTTQSVDSPVVAVSTYTTQTNGTDGTSINAGTPLPPTTEVAVLGDINDSTNDTGNVSASTDEATTEDDSEDDCFQILSICWYWWLLLIVAAGVGYGAYRMINSEEDEA